MTEAALCTTPQHRLGLPFWLLLIGDAISSLGTQLASFALSVWIYQQTGSVMDFVGTIVCAVLPAVAVTPIAGAIVDKINRFHVMLCADFIAALVTVLLLISIWFDQLTLVHLYVFIAVTSVGIAFQVPAAQASIKQIVDGEALTRATAAMGVSSTLVRIVSPALAGTLLLQIHLAGMVILDLVSFVLAALCVWRAYRLLALSRRTRGQDVFAAVGASLTNFSEAANFIGRDLRLRVLLFYTVLQAVLVTMSVKMSVPLILSLYSSQSLGWVMSFCYIGALLGSLSMVLVKGPAHRIKAIFLCDAVLSASVLLVGVVTQLPLFCALILIAGIAGSVSTCCLQAVWLTHVPDRKLGSVLTLMTTLTLISTAAVAILSGFAVEHLLAPALQVGGALADSVGVLIGVGEGRGLALMFALTGALGLSMSLLGWRYRPLRQLGAAQ